MKKLTNLNEILAFQLEGMYEGEKALQHQLPTFSEGVQNLRLREEIKKYLDRSIEKRSKLKRIFSYLLVPASKRKNKVVEVLIKEAQAVVDKASESYLRDVVFAACLQTINHYNAANYRAALAIAVALNLDQVTDLLHEILQWENETFIALEKIAFEELGKDESVAST
jgi:ferritin-like metal-binding protein YciE